MNAFGMLNFQIISRTRRLLVKNIGEPRNLVSSTVSLKDFGIFYLVGSRDRLKICVLTAVRWLN